LQLFFLFLKAKSRLNFASRRTGIYVLALCYQRLKFHVVVPKGDRTCQKT
jgi:hypothetical protein